MLTEEQIQEAERILRRRACGKLGHDFDIVTNQMSNRPTGIKCGRCHDHWRVLPSADQTTQVMPTVDAPTQVMSTVDSPTQIIQTIDAPTQVIPRQR